MKISKSLTQGFCSSISIIIVFSILLLSCKTERISYFKDISDTISSAKAINLSSFTSPVVRTDDILNITIQTIDPSANQVLNEGNLPVLSGAVSGSPSATQAAVAGYLVDKDGYLHMPYIGNVYVKGYSTEQIRDTITSKIAIYFQNPVVNVRFANFKVTVLGEVRNPATFIIPNEKPTVIDALGLAGDITIYGKRENVLLMRDEDGKKNMVRLNLDSSKTISSQYFYLRPDDVLYVEPTASKVESTNAYRVRDIALFGAALTLLTVIVNKLIK